MQPQINTGMLDAERRVAQAELGAARAELRRITMMLNDTTVRAPIDGIVGRRFVEVGEKAGQDTLLLTLFNTETLYAQIEVAEADLRKLQVGQLNMENALQDCIAGKRKSQQYDYAYCHCRVEGLLTLALRSVLGNVQQYRDVAYRVNYGK